ncbi:hypothetical protein [Streptomyces sp. NPDC005181]|uniref:hypothetical protein n=1 Tax=Streptomyces sp. NPDC005181 TaxID=3156869 RepID=UPI0033B1BE2F
MSAKPHALPPSVPELTGVWHPSLLVGADGRRDTTTAVTWVQGPARYADLRQPANHPRHRGVTSLCGLRFDELLALTRQEAFAGRLRQRSAVFHWARALDFGPVGLPDAGRLRREGAVLVARPGVVAGEHLYAQTVQTFRYLGRRLADGETALPAGALPLSSFGQEARHAPRS